MQLFDIVKSIFSSKAESWKPVGQIDKSRNFFMINRLMSIQFPIQANQFNKLKVNPVYVVDWWRDTLSKRYSKPPTWIYTKTKKATKENSEEMEINEEAENFIRNKFEVSKRDLRCLKLFYPDKYSVWTKDIAEQLGLNEKKQSNEKL